MVLAPKELFGHRVDFLRRLFPDQRLRRAGSQPRRGARGSADHASERLHAGFHNTLDVSHDVGRATAVPIRVGYSLSLSPRRFGLASGDSIRACA